MVQTNRLIRMQALACARDYPYYIEISFVFGSLLVYMFGSLLVYTTIS
jgi:hypothetical protein